MSGVYVVLREARNAYKMLTGKPEESFNSEV
jgi:hypothetical protein